MRTKLWASALSGGVAAFVVIGTSSGADFYGVRFNGQLVRVDTTAQTVTGLGNIFAGPQTPNQFEELEFDGAGTLYAIRGFNDGNFPPTNFNQAYRVLNPTTGQSLLSANFDNSTAKRHANVAFRPSNGLFYSNRNMDGHMGTLNMTTGAFNDTSGVANGLRNVVEALAIDPTTGNAYGVIDNGLSIFGEINYSLTRVNLDTGIATLVGSFGQGSAQFKALRFDSAGTAYTTNYATGDFYTVNLATGAATFAFAGGAGLNQITGLAYIVPAPGAAAMLAAAGMFAARRRRQGTHRA